MKEFTMENQGTSTYLIYDLTRDAIDTMSLGMITNNKITGFVPALYTQEDSRKYLKYNVSSRITLKQFFMGAVNKKRLLGVFTSIVTALMAAEEYMIDMNSILLDEDYIFVDVSTNKAEVICVPIMDMGMPLNDMGAFFKNIMFCTQFDSGEDCDYVARIINYLNSTPVISLNSFGALLHELENMTMVLQERMPGMPQAAVPSAAAQNQLQQKVQQLNQPETASTAQQPEMPQRQETQQRPEMPQRQETLQRPEMPHVPGGMQGPGMVQKAGSKVQPEIPNMHKPAPQFSIPKSQPEVPVMKPQKKTTESASQEGKENISLFYLLQHYNKENAAAYKAQKQAKKSSEAQKDKKIKEKKGNAAAIPPVPNGYQGGIPAPRVETGTEIAYGASRGISGQIPQSVNELNQTVMQQNHAVQPDCNSQKNVTTQQPYPVAMPQQSYAQAAASPAAAGNFGETTVLNAAGAGETTVLGAVQQGMPVQPYLIRLKNNERITLNKTVFRIGKEKSFVDYFIGDNTAVSRSHANFISRDGKYYVQDTNSTNHTFV
ncbi:MAG: DUF6382 domain-containing protein, partial [Roseburia sp.]